MWKKIFISYKYWDNKVRKIENHDDTARKYVDILEDYFDEWDNIYKGESDDEDLSSLTEETIVKKLADRIYDSTITIVLISKNMMEYNKTEKDQRIPWEISYSLKEINRGGRQSLSNAILAVVIPDENDSYEHFIKENTCEHCNCITFQTNSTFKIIKNNMFNRKSPEIHDCHNHPEHNKPHIWFHSYIHCIKRDNFILDPNNYLNAVIKINEKIDDYEIMKNI